MVEEYRFGEQSKERTKIKKPDIKIFGIGGAGRNILSSVVGDPSFSKVDFFEIGGKSRIDGASFIKADKKSNKKVWESGIRMNLREIKDFKRKISKATEGADMVFFLSGLGGKTGSYTTPICSYITRENKVFTSSFVAMPFEMEGEERKRQADASLKDLLERDDITAVFENDRLLKKKPHLPMTKAFNVMNQIISLPIKDINHALTAPDLPKLREYTEGVDEFRIGGGYGKGRKKGKRAVKKAFNSPFLNDEEDHNTIISFIRKGIDPCEFVNEDVLSEIKNRFPRSDIIWGTIRDKSIGERTRVNILAGR